MSYYITTHTCQFIKRKQYQKKLEKIKPLTIFSVQYNMINYSDKKYLIINYFFVNTFLTFDIYSQIKSVCYLGGKK